MGSLLQMPSEKKSPDPPKKRKPAKPLNASVKVTEEMKEKLEEVANDLATYPGELIELKMGAWLNTESLRIRKAKYEAARRAAGTEGRN